MSKIQTLANKKGEVEFRKKLAVQFEGKTTVYEGQPSGEEYLQIIKDRVKAYTTYFKDLKSKKIPLGHYLEIGAGVGQGAMLLENKFNAHGFTSDISLETLKLGDKYLKLLDYKKMPLRICCDLYNLPFLSNSIPFIFTFQTLHHLPDPLPVLKEIKRVLTQGGYFYFNEEPIAQVFNLNLWRRDLHLKWFEKLLKATIILHFISRIGKSEVDHNVLEETFTLSTWEEALNLFPRVDAFLSIFPFSGKIHQTRTKKAYWLTPPFWKRLPLQILGGGIGAICQKEGNSHKLKYNTLHDLLACPNCVKKPKLKVTKNGDLLCNVCRSYFKNKNGVLMLFSKKQERVLYPNT